MPNAEGNTQVRIHRHTAAYWQRLAKSFGFLHTRGPLAGIAGNIAALMEAVERGEYEVRAVAPRDELPAHQENAS